MPRNRILRFNAESVTISWWACERCHAVGPRLMRVLKGGRERTVIVGAQCCQSGRPSFDASVGLDGINTD